MTLHIRSLEKFLLERGNNVIQVVRLMDESYTYTQTVHWHQSMLFFDVTKMFRAVSTISASSCATNRTQRLAFFHNGGTYIIIHIHVFLAAPSTSRKGLKFVKQLRAQAAPFASIPTALDFLTGSRRGDGNEDRGNRKPAATSASPNCSPSRGSCDRCWYASTSVDRLPRSLARALARCLGIVGIASIRLREPRMFNNRDTRTSRY